MLMASTLLKIQTAVSGLILEGKYDLTVPREKVWELIVDPSKIGKCLPDLKTLEIESENKFVALIRVGVGPIRTDFKFKIEIVGKEPPSRVRLKAMGSGSGNSVNLDLAIELRDIPIGSELSYKSDVRIGGMMVGLGQRLIGDATEKTVAGVFECIKKQLEQA